MSTYKYERVNMTKGNTRPQRDYYIVVPTGDPQTMRIIKKQLGYDGNHAALQYANEQVPDGRFSVVRRAKLVNTLADAMQIRTLKDETLAYCLPERDLGRLVARGWRVQHDCN